MASEGLVWDSEFLSNCKNLVVTSTGKGSFPRYNRLVTSRICCEDPYTIDGDFIFFCPSWENDPIFSEYVGNGLNPPRGL